MKKKFLYTYFITLSSLFFPISTFAEGSFSFDNQQETSDKESEKQLNSIDEFNVNEFTEAITRKKRHNEKKEFKTAKKPDGWQEIQGVFYKIISPAKPDAPSTRLKKYVRVHYTAWLYDQKTKDVGKKIDSSIDRKKPFEFILGIGQTIKGWDIIVATMKVGEKRRILIPSHLAYGIKGIPSIVPPHADLIFEIEVMGI